jgi:hypothetical protein
MFTCTAISILFHIVSATFEAFLLLCDDLFCSLLEEACVGTHGVTTVSTSQPFLNLCMPRFCISAGNR